MFGGSKSYEGILIKNVSFGIEGVLRYAFLCACGSVSALRWSGKPDSKYTGYFGLKTNTRGRINNIYYSFFCPETKGKVSLLRQRPYFGPPQNMEKTLRSKGEMTRHQSHQKPSCQRVCVTSLLCRGGLPLTTRVSICRISCFHFREKV